MNSLTDPAVPDVVLERYRLGELPPAEIERLARQLEDDTDLRGRLEAIEASDLEMVRAGVPDLLSCPRARPRRPATGRTFHTRLGRPPRGGSFPPLSLVPPSPCWSSVFPASGRASASPLLRHQTRWNATFA